MKIAVTVENNNRLENMVTQHFNKLPYFIMVNKKNGETISTQGVTNPFVEAHQPGQTPGFIHEQKANIILISGPGRRAIEFFEQLGIQASIRANSKEYACH